MANRNRILLFILAFLIAFIFLIGVPVWGGDVTTQLRSFNTLNAMVLDDVVSVDIDYIETLFIFLIITSFLKIVPLKRLILQRVISIKFRIMLLTPKIFDSDTAKITPAP